MPKPKPSFSDQSDEQYPDQTPVYPGGSLHGPMIDGTKWIRHARPAPVGHLDAQGKLARLSEPAPKRNAALRGSTGRTEDPEATR